MRARKFFYDLHIHTSRYSSCSGIAPEMAVEMALRRGLDGIALTEHCQLWTPQEIDELKAQAGCPSFPVLRGCELPTWSGDRETGDVLVFGVARVPEKRCTIDELCRLVHQEGGIVIAAHPWVDVIGMGDRVLCSAVDAIEVGNHRYQDATDPRQLRSRLRKPTLPAIASSDAHSAEEIGRFCMESSRKIVNESDLVAAFHEGACRPRLKPPPAGVWRRWLR